MKQISTPQKSSRTSKPVWIIGLFIMYSLFNQVYAQSSCTSTITSNFNGTSIPAGRYIWFNAHFKVTGLTSSPTSIDVDNSSITFSANGTNYNLIVPRSTITFSSSATSSTYTFDNATQRWTITVPYNVNNNVFFGGLAFPSPGLPGGIDPVNWTATFTTNQPGIQLDWQWGAAVYTNFSGNYNQLGITVADGSSGHAGSPENYASYAVGGARGGGAANTTGSWSGTGHTAPCSCSGNGTIEGTVWNDLQNPAADGIHEASEPGIANVTVKLYNSSNTLLASTITDGSGHYLFTNVPVGTNLTVGFTKPLGYDFTQKNAPGSNNSNNSDANPQSGKTDPITLGGCQHLVYDAGLVCNICSPTALSLGQLSATNQNGVALLLWSTSSEANLDHFDIQRSTDGINFSSIGKVNSAGNSVDKTDYIFRDMTPQADNNYYRIEAIDANAIGLKYSNVAAINNLVKGFMISSVAPNPFRDHVQIILTSDKTQPYTIRLIDVSGRVVFTQPGIASKGSSIVKLNNLGNVQRGLYILEARAESSQSHLQVTKD